MTTFNVNLYTYVLAEKSIEVEANSIDDAIEEAERLFDTDTYFALPALTDGWAFEFSDWPDGGFQVNSDAETYDSNG